MPKFGDDQQSNDQEKATDKFIVQCEVAMNGGGEEQMGEEEEKVGQCKEMPGETFMDRSEAIKVNLGEG